MKTVVITGSSIGIGRETAYKFAAKEWAVVVTYYKDKEEAGKTATRCRELGAADILVLHLDVMNNRSITEAKEAIRQKFGLVDVLINNAGVVNYKDFEALTVEEIETEVRTNLEGLIKVTHAFLPLVRETIINIASILGFSAEEKVATYSATKWGVRGFTKALALELPDKKVYVVNPAGTATRMNDFGGMPPEKVAAIILNTAEGKYALPSGSDINVLEYIDK